VTRLGRSTLLLNSKAPEQMTAECWRWRPRWNRLASSASCFGSSACLQSSSSVLCKTAYGLESPQDRLGGTHAEGAGHPDKLPKQSQKCQVTSRRPGEIVLSLVCSGTVQVWWMMNAKSVADHHRHVVRRLQNCVIHTLSFSFWVPSYLHVLLNEDNDGQCWQQPEYNKH